jgi:hypothetical protein
MTTSITASTTRRLGGALLALGLMLGAGDARAQTTETLSAVKDSFLRSGAADRNEGANPGLRLQASGRNRVVVGFDPGAIEDFLADNTLTTATLVLTIADNADNWGRSNDRTVDAHPLGVDFAEGDGQNAGVPGSQSTRGNGPGVTWNCATDAEIANQATDCDPEWDGGDFGAVADSVVHLNGLSDEVSWVVTLDVEAGASAWLLKKTNEGQPGRVSYHSKESAEAAGDPDLAPRLIFEGEPQGPACGGETSKCVFVTSSSHQGDFGGLDGGDAICNARASEAGLPGTYVAWLSTQGDGNSAADRLNHAAVPYKLVNGETVADDYNDLVTCDVNAANCLQHPIDLTETGSGPVVANAWTGTLVFPVVEATFDNCLEWQDTRAISTVGATPLTNIGWSMTGLAGCVEFNRFYCFQQ